MPEDNLPSADAPSLGAAFREDHRRLEDLLGHVVDQLEAGRGDQARALWRECEEGLIRHLQTEEALLLPDLLTAKPREARALLEEHRHIRQRLAELTLGLNRAVRPDRVQAFVDELRAHASHEEGTLYLWAEMAVEPSQQQAAIARLRGQPTAASARS